MLWLILTTNFTKKWRGEAVRVAVTNQPIKARSCDKIIYWNIENTGQFEFISLLKLYKTDMTIFLPHIAINVHRSTKLFPLICFVHKHLESRRLCLIYFDVINFTKASSCRLVNMQKNTTTNASMAILIFMLVLRAMCVARYRKV